MHQGVVSLASKNWRRQPSVLPMIPATVRRVAPSREDWNRGVEITLRQSVFDVPALRLADGALRLHFPFPTPSAVEIPAEAVEAARATGYRHRGAGFILEIAAEIFNARLPAVPEARLPITFPSRTAA
jgi:hypothetical protein